MKLQTIVKNKSIIIFRRERQLFLNLLFFLYYLTAKPNLFEVGNKYRDYYYLQWEHHKYFTIRTIFSSNPVITEPSSVSEARQCNSG